MITKGQFKSCPLKETLWDAVAQCLDAVKPDECQNHFATAGYGPE